ncbi:MAG: right-handed parallel beta-helix repeat-containing protein [Candidatus Thorarchaeota archaeon]
MFIALGLLLTPSITHDVSIYLNPEIIAAEENEFGIDPDDYTMSGPLQFYDNNGAEWNDFLGEGTNESPYVIEGLYFNMNSTDYDWEVTGSAVIVNHVTAYWIIRNCVFRGGNELVEDPDGDFIDVDGMAIDTMYAENGIVENCTFIWLHTGLNLERSSNIIVRNNVFHGCTMEQERDVELPGVSLHVDSYVCLGRAVFGYEGSHHLYILANQIYNSSPGILFSNVAYSQVEGNEIIGCETGIVIIDGSRMNNATENYVYGTLLVGISIHSSTDSFLLNNSLILNYWGLWVDDASRNHTFAYNIMEDNGLAVFGLSPGDFTLAQIAPLGYGLRISDGTSTKMVWNDFVNDDISARNDAEGNLYDYNYYSSYNGADENNDNIGDTPYDVEGDAPTQDVHPRLKRLDYTPATNTTGTNTTSETSGVPMGIIMIAGLGGGISLIVIAFVIFKRR